MKRLAPRGVRRLAATDSPGSEGTCSVQGSQSLAANESPRLQEWHRRQRARSSCSHELGDFQETKEASRGARTKLLRDPLAARAWGLAAKACPPARAALPSFLVFANRC